MGNTVHRMHDSLETVKLERSMSTPTSTVHPENVGYTVRKMHDILETETRQCFSEPADSEVNLVTIRTQFSSEQASPLEIDHLIKGKEPTMGSRQP